MFSRKCRTPETTVFRLARSASFLSGGLSSNSLTEGILRKTFDMSWSPNALQANYREFHYCRSDRAMKTGCGCWSSREMPE
jgi:hypothetical protein